jgi:hypothetical protein
MKQIVVMIIIMILAASVWYLTRKPTPASTPTPTSMSQSPAVSTQAAPLRFGTWTNTLVASTSLKTITIHEPPYVIADVSIAGKDTQMIRKTLGNGDELLYGKENFLLFYGSYVYMGKFMMKRIGGTPGSLIGEWVNWTPEIPPSTPPPTSSSSESAIITFDSNYKLDNKRGQNFIFSAKDASYIGNISDLQGIRLIYIDKLDKILLGAPISTL